MTLAYLGVGSNVGDRRAAIELAARELAKLPGTRVLRTSTLIETDPVGMAEDTGRFLNGVLEVETSLPAGKLLEAMLHIETLAGRLPPGQRIKWGPRTLDLDILLFGDQIIDEPGLQVPHPHMHTRAFVLIPLAELAPDANHPLLNRRVAELLTDCEN